MNVNPSEKVFYQSGNILVTNSRFVANGTTFAMNNITSVRLHYKPHNFLYLLIIGILAALFQSVTIVIFVIGVGAVMYFAIKPPYTIIIRTNAGEQKTFSSTDSEIVQQVADAINEAMIYRG